MAIVGEDEDRLTTVPVLISRWRFTLFDPADVASTNPRITLGVGIDRATGPLFISFGLAAE
jgi:hypothetical protein